jgi:signal transduction histidine kinase
LEAIPSDVALCIYRVTQEALRNIARHSGARSAEVTLTGSGAALELRVADQGRGFDRKHSEAPRGLGLAAMEERVRLLRGSFDLKTRPGAGTELMAQIPLGT